MKKLYFILIIFITIKLNAQEVRTAISGTVQFNSVGIEDVHIVNQTSRRGTVSTKNGDFKITVKENDTLKFSNIQFKTRKIIISKNILQKGILKINLSLRTNELNEVVVVKRKNMAKELGLPNAGKEPLKPIERKLNYINKGGAIDQLYSWVTGEKKKLKLLQKRQEEDRIALDNKINVQLIRNHFKEDFFIYTLNVPGKNIEGLIYFCLPDNIVYLFENKRYMEIVDIFIKKKETYLSSLQKVQ
jgi:hypothetical protein